jgi:molybdate transport system ATP-binding protein
MSFDIRLIKRLPEHILDIGFKTGAGITALFGPSGAGKSSVLNMVAGVLKPDRGHIVVGGTVLFDSDSRVAVRPELRRAGYIFQDGRLFPHLTVRQNLLYGARLTPARNQLLSVEETIGFLGIEPLLHRRPDTLSGGEAQRVAIGRALLAGPRFLLMDEPLTFLDEQRREEILAIVERLRDTLGLPILYVSHDRAEIARLAATIVPV